MRYLGVEILKTKSDFYSIGAGAYNTPYEIINDYTGTLSKTKEVIRHWELPEYKPTKTLEWLQEQTNSVWYYQNYGEVLWTVSSSLDAEIRYNICTNILTHENLGSEFGQSWTVTPREFIEKIAKGEWV